MSILTDLQGVYRRSGRVQDVTSEFRSDSHSVNVYCIVVNVYIFFENLNKTPRGPTCICTHLTGERGNTSSSLCKNYATAEIAVRL